jgi:ribonucleases P/MRP protein subunit RPP40
MHIAHNFETKYTMQKDTLIKTDAERDLGIVTTSNMKVSTQCSKAAIKAMQILRLIKRHFSHIDREDFQILYKSFIRPHLEYCVQAESPFLVKDVRCLEQVQRRATKMVEGLEHLDYERRLTHLGLQSLVNRRLRGDLIETNKIITGKEKVDPSQFFKFNQVKHNLRGHKFKLTVVRSRLEIRRQFFSQRVVEHWNRLPAAVVETTIVNSFKTKLDEWLKI